MANQEEKPEWAKELEETHKALAAKLNEMSEQGMQKRIADLEKQIADLTPPKIEPATKEETENVLRRMGL